VGYPEALVCFRQIVQLSTVAKATHQAQESR